MKKIPTKPFQPVVTMEQMELYKSENPETHTASPFMNAVCDAIEVLGLVDARKLAAHMHLNARDVSAAIRVLTGTGWGELRLTLEKRKFWRLKAENPKMTDQEALKQMGLTHRSTSWRIKHNINQGTHQSRYHRYGAKVLEEYKQLLKNNNHES